MIFKEQKKCYLVLNSTFELAKNWLLNSGIFISEQNDENFGGVYSFYDEEKKSFSFLYPEITGYYSSTMRFLYTHEKNDDFLQRAKASCDWLIKLFDSYGGIIQGITPDKKPMKFVYSFDTAICAKGILDFYEISKDEKYLIFAKKLNRWIIDTALNSDGTINPLYDLESKQFISSKDVWYKQYGCLHIKTIMSLLSEYKITNDELLLSNALTIANNVKNFQNKDGSIRLHSKDKVINLHTLCYALEGLLYCYSVTKEDTFLNSCKNALKWCDQQIKNDGSIDLWFNSKYHSKSSYPIAQIIRIKILLSKLTNSFEPEYLSNLKFLNSLQSTNSNLHSNGGFYEEFYKSVFNWKKRPRVNSWASMFALQAFFWHENLSKIDFNREIELLY